MKHYTTIVLGGGPSGISCADHLKKRGMDYLIIERKVMLQSWRHERWDSFYLVTPNWMTHFPGLEDDIPYDNHYMSKNEILDVLEAYLKKVNPNYIENTQVSRVYKENDYYYLETNRGQYQCQNLIIATGLFNEPYYPTLKVHFPSSVKQMHSMDYTNVTELLEGGTLVIGSGRSGIQIALEVKEQTNSSVYLAVGSLTPIPSIYKNINGVYWLNQLSGYNQGPTILPYESNDFEDEKIMKKFAQNLANCQKAGVTLTGRLLDVQENKVIFADNLKQTILDAEAVMKRVERRIDGFIEEKALTVSDTLISMNFERVDIMKLNIVTEVDVEQDHITNVIWCTGFKPDYKWLALDIFKDNGAIDLIDGVKTREQVSFCGLSLESDAGEKSAFGVGLYAVYESAGRAVAALI
jgi:putative flavoprotein involved in K+ transport